MASQSVGMNRPSTILNPTGVCIQLLSTRIQNVEKSVPIATISADDEMRPTAGRSLRPNSRTPRKAASRKNAVSPS